MAGELRPPSATLERMNALARLSAVSKRFGDVVALDDVHLEVLPGEVLGLLGPNGAGKTTALSILCGLQPPDEGSVEVGGVDVQQDALAARRHLAWVPDGAPLYAGLSPRQHLKLVGELHGMERAEAETEAERLLEAFELSARIDSPVGQFSRGMRQKVALCCALLPRPRLLVLDEPLSGLDAPTAGVVKEVLRGWAAGGGSVIYSSHLLDVVERVCDRMAILDGGRLVACGSMDELRGAGADGASLEQVFGAVTRAEDPAAQAARILGRA